MSKGKWVFTLAILLLLAGFFTYPCIQPQIVEDMGLYVLEGVSSGRFQVGENVEFSQLDPSEKIVQRALARPSFQSVYLVEKDVVLIMEGALFQSVSGYLVTTGERELPAQYETGLKGLDMGGRVWTTRINDHLYSWTGGL